MSKIKESNYTKICRDHIVSVSDLENILKKANLPKTLRLETKKLVDFFKSYDLNQHKEKGKVLKGQVFTSQELKKILVEVTGYTKWKLDDRISEDNYGEAILEDDDSAILDQYGLSVENKKDIVSCAFVRDVNDRNAVWLIKFTCFPGVVNICFDTDRAGWDTDGLVENAQIKNVIRINCDY